MEFLVQFYFNERYFTANTQTCRLKNVIQFGNSILVIWNTYIFKNSEKSFYRCIQRK